MKQAPMKTLGPLLKEVRESKGITRKDFAEMTGYDARTLQRAEEGNTNITIQTLSDMCDALNVSATTVLSEVTQ